MFFSHVIHLHLKIIEHKSSIMNLNQEHNIKVSCDILHSFTPGSSWFGLTDHSWSFYTDIGVLLLCLSWFCLELFQLFSVVVYCWLTTVVVTCDNIRRWGNLRHLCHNLVQPKDQHALRLEVFVFFVKCHALQILNKICLFRLCFSSTCAQTSSAVGYQTPTQLKSPNCFHC